MNKALIAATYVGAEILPVDPNADDTMGSGSVPVLETVHGCIFSTNAITRYIARIRRDVGLYGNNLLEDGLIDSWIEFCTNELEIPLMSWIFSAKGTWEVDPAVTTQAKLDVKRVLEILDKHFLENTYFVGHRITLADICVCCMVTEGFQCVFDEEYRKPYMNLIRWFNLCTAQPEFHGVLGKVAMCHPAQPSAKETVPKVEEQPKQKETVPKAAEQQKQQPKKKESEQQNKQQQSNKNEKKGKEKKEQPVAKSEGKKQGKKEAPKEEVPPEKTPEEIEQERKAKLKKVVKEGGKRGVEIEGAADMGGLEFFCTSVDEPDGDMEMLSECMKAMNAKSDPKDEERKGGSGHIGKMIFSAGTSQLAILAYVPDTKKGVIDCIDWLKATFANNGGEVLEGSTPLLAKGVIAADPEKGKFPLKIKEPSITEAINYLKAKGVFPDKDDSDDDFIFGDDDFPS